MKGGRLLRRQMMGHAEFLKALDAIENPLRFASRKNFENLSRVRDLENTLARAAGRAREIAPSQDLVGKVDDFINALPPPNGALEARVAAFQACMKLLSGMRAGLEGPDLAARPKFAPYCTTWQSSIVPGT